MTKKRFSPKSRNAVVVLGMHRSGTSALAGVLARLGCDLPQTPMPTNDDNAKGYYESLRLYEMNDAILRSGGAQWDDWQPFNPDWGTSHRAEEFLASGAETLTAEYGTSRMFVLKDPRMCVLMPFWNRLFEQEEITPTYVHIHRNPVEVATSLYTRDGLPLTYGVLLWLRHVLDAELGSRGALRCFTSYDQLLGNWTDVIAQIKANTGLVFSRTSDSVNAEISTFLTPDMNTSAITARNTHQSPLLSQWAGRIFEVLERWTTQGEDPADFTTFDDIRAEMDGVAPLFGTLIRDARTATQHKTALEVVTAELDTLRAQTTTQTNDSQASINGYQLQAQDMLARLQAAQTEVEATRQQIAHEQALREEMQQTLDKLAKKKKTLRKALTAQQAAHDDASAQQLTARQTARQTATDLDAQLTAVTQEVEQLTKTLTEIDQEKWQLQSELAQRTSETVDLDRQNTEHAAQAATLTAQLDDLKTAQAAQIQENEQLKKSARLLQVNTRKELEQKFETALAQLRTQSDAEMAALRHAADTQTQENEQLKKSGRMMRVNLQKELEQKFETALTQVRTQSDAEIATLRYAADTQTQENEQLKKSGRMMRVNLQKELEQKLQATLMQNRKSSEKMRDDLAKSQAQQHQRIAELEGDNWALRHSTSWKITKPLRSLVLFLRPR